MSRLRLRMMMSVDGYTSAPGQSAEDPFGVGGMVLTEWVFALRAFREEHGMEGGEDNASTQIIEQHFENIGASVMGRNMFGGGPGPWGDDPWMGFWGDNPPYHHPVFVLTHHPRESVEMEGGTTFHFVTDGLESALAQAREAAGGQDVSLGGGGTTARAAIAAGLVDDMLITIVPVFLGGGTRLFDDLGSAPRRLEQVESIAAPDVTHVRFRFL